MDLWKIQEKIILMAVQNGLGAIRLKRTDEPFSTAI